MQMWKRAPTVSSRPWKLGEILALGALAAVARLLNLGTYSMWLDEILGTSQARAGLAQTWQALRADAVHPPLEGLISWALIHLGAGETTRRLLPIVLGIATVLILSRWTAGRFGHLAGVLTGALAALSPLHVHYSQELRPYSLGLFFCVLALSRLDALVRSPGLANVLFLWIACLGCLLSFYFATLIFVPLTLLLAGEARSPSPEIRRNARRLLRRSPLFLAALASAYLPWIGVVLSLGQRAIEFPATAWSGALAGERWQFLAVGGVEGRPLAWGGALALVLFLVGAAAGLRSAAGRAVLAGALAGTLGVELALRWADHWSNGRYNLVAWPFLTVLTALGITALAAGLAGVLRRRWEPLLRLPLTAALLALLLAVQLQGIGEYYRQGRPQWNRIARAAAALHRPPEPIFAANDWTAICLGYYLEQDSQDPRRPPISLGGDPDLAAGRWDSADCALLVVGGYPSSERLESQLRRWRKVQDLTRAGVRLYLLDAPAHRGVAFSPCRERYLPRELRRPPPVTALAAVPAPRERLRLEFDRPTTASALLYGWSGFETRRDGVSFLWATGRRAALGLLIERPRRLRLRLELWPHAGPGRRQRLAVTLNGAPLGERELEPRRQVVELAAPAGLWQEGENVVVFTFAYAVSPAEVDPGATDPRPLAAAFDRLTLAGETLPASDE